MYARFAQQQVFKQELEVLASSKVQIIEATHVVSKIQNYLKVLEAKVQRKSPTYKVQFFSWNLDKQDLRMYARFAQLPLQVCFLTTLKYPGTKRSFLFGQSSNWSSTSNKVQIYRGDSSRLQDSELSQSQLQARFANVCKICTAVLKSASGQNSKFQLRAKYKLCFPNTHNQGSLRLPPKFKLLAMKLR